MLRLRSWAYCAKSQDDVPGARDQQRDDLQKYGGMEALMISDMLAMEDKNFSLCGKSANVRFGRNLADPSPEGD